MERKSKRGRKEGIKWKRRVYGRGKNNGVKEDVRRGKKIGR